MHLTRLDDWLFGLPYPAVDCVTIEPPEAVHSLKTGLAKCVEAIPVFCRPFGDTRLSDKAVVINVREYAHTSEGMCATWRRFDLHGAWL